MLQVATPRAFDPESDLAFRKPTSELSPQMAHWCELGTPVPGNKGGQTGGCGQASLARQVAETEPTNGLDLHKRLSRYM